MNGPDRPPPRLITSGVIAAQLRVPIHRAVYVLATRRHVRPAAYAGILRLYTKADVRAARRELAGIRRRRYRLGRR